MNLDHENNCGQCGRRCASGTARAPVRGRRRPRSAAVHGLQHRRTVDTAPAQLLENAIPSARRAQCASSAIRSTPCTVIATVRTTLDTTAANRGRTEGPDELHDEPRRRESHERGQFRKYRSRGNRRRPRAGFCRHHDRRRGGVIHPRRRHVTVLAGAGGRGAEMAASSASAGLVTVTGKKA